ncbi:MAG: tRNA (adenosine(37)-N6)-threonylcarbamoyltransferase complex transferase subunit TsaD [Verrucomicrobiota bacterium]|nr:tRNA (adenosine(37)-N6)-threonylcarbamoyltransferase complex transferase subunit TsaD [Verrucomicrobiota bacterium]
MHRLLLAIETSCDETAIAVLRGRELLASEVASQVAAHQPYGGVVPEVASRHHLQRAPQLLARAVAAANISLGAVDAFAATSGPGLASSLMIGASLAKGLALGFGKPYLAINHLEGHLLSPFFVGAGEIAPNVSLIVSGGHTLLVLVDGVGQYQVMGRTLDDAAGEAFDKVGKMLGLSYPGGPEIERAAQDGDPARFALPRGMLNSGDANFSFSGLKTAVRYLLPKTTAEDRADLCASFQCAVVEVLVAKTIAAARAAKRSLVTVSGGVSCNEELRRQMSLGCERAGLDLRFAAPALCTDNAAMIGFAAQLHLERGESTPLTTEINPNLALA